MFKNLVIQVECLDQDPGEAYRGLNTLASHERPIDAVPDAVAPMTIIHDDPNDDPDEEED